MAVTEGRRRQLFEAAERALGTEEAETLMELVPAGFEPATRSDLIELRAELKGDIASLQRQFLTALLAATLTHIGVTAALLALLR